MKKSIVLVIASLFLIAGVVYASGNIKSELNNSKFGVEMPDKDPKAKTASESKDKTCCSSDKSTADKAACKSEGKSCSGTARAEGKSECCSKSKAEGSAVHSDKPAAGPTTSAAVEKSNCAKTKCQ